jgi:hypothetical protein
MTKWICNGCGGKPCKLDICNDDTTLIPTKCVRYTYQVHPCWKRDCTEEIGAAKFKMTYTYKELDKKVQDLITAGQGQMARIQALEKEVARSTDSYLQKQIDALDKKIDDLEGKYRAHSHIYGTHQWDQYTSQPRYMG